MQKSARRQPLSCVTKLLQRRPDHHTENQQYTNANKNIPFRARVHCTRKHRALSGGSEDVRDFA